MNLLIIGGSNSIMSNGYLDYALLYLRALYGDYVFATNISVGGTTSLSAIGRLYETFTNADFDYVIYEYSINDSGHFG